jgi:replicative DNA helicase
MAKVENRGLPAAIECERVVLAVAMMDSGAMHDMRPLLTSGDFSVHDNGRIWDTMAWLYDNGRSFDRISIFEEMQRRKQPITLSLLLDLEEGTPQLTSVDNYVQIVKDKSLLRHIIFACRSVASRCLDGTESPQSILDGFGEIAMNLIPKDGHGGLQSAGELIEEFGLETLMTPRIKNGLLFPWKWMNYWTCGMLPAELWVLAGHTSTGKTSAMLQHAVHAAQKGSGVAIFSLEVGKKALFQKAVYQLARVDSEKAKHGESISEEDRYAVLRATNELYELPIYFDTAATTVPAIHAAVRRRRVKSKVDHVIVDYLQLLGNSERRDNRAQAVGANAWALKMLATDFQIPVLLLSQFSRPSKEGKPRRPELSDLKESGDIENHANGVWFLHREAQEDSDQVSVDFMLPKQRDGRRNIASPMWFFPRYQRFEEQERG